VRRRPGADALPLASGRRDKLEPPARVSGRVRGDQAVVDGGIEQCAERRPHDADVRFRVASGQLGGQERPYLAPLKVPESLLPEPWQNVRPKCMVRPGIVGALTIALRCWSHWAA
jgi:hypothetical protein